MPERTHEEDGAYRAHFYLEVKLYLGAQEWGDIWGIFTAGRIYVYSAVRS